MENSTPRATDWWQSHENIVSGDSPVSFELFVRSLGAGIGAHSRQTSIFDRIDRLDGRDVIDEAEVTVWGDCVCVSECCSRNSTVRSVRDTVERFRAWGREKRDVSLGFDRRRVSSSITGEEFDVIDVPTTCLAVYDHRGLGGIFPAVIDGEEWTIDTYLDWFERVRETTESKVVADA